MNAHFKSAFQSVSDVLINRFSEWRINLESAFHSLLLHRLICVEDIYVHPTENRFLCCSVVSLHLLHLCFHPGVDIGLRVV